MSLYVSEGSGSTFDPLANGTYPAVCYGVVDEGEQYNETFGKWTRKVRLMFELPGETITIDGEEVSRTLSTEYTASLNAKGKLRGALEAWRGRAFTVEELKRFDLKNIVGVPCLLSVINQDGKNGKSYTNINGMMALPKGMPMPACREERIVFDLDESDLAMLKQFPQYLQEKIMKSRTYEERIAGMGEAADDGSGAAEAFVGAMQDADGDLPF